MIPFINTILNVIVAVRTAFAEGAAGHDSALAALGDGEVSCLK